MPLNQKDAVLLKKLGLKLRKLREEKDWTLEETEEYGWQSWKHLQKIESGKKNINFSTLKKLADLYGQSISQLLKGI